MNEQEADHYLISALDEIAWTLNLRGRDVDFNPVFVAYSVVTLDTVILFTDIQKISQELKEKLSKDGILLKDYQAITHFLEQLPSLSLIHI